MFENLAEFHFLRPYWLALLVPSALLLWALRHPSDGRAAWRRICDERLLPYLLIGAVGHRARSFLWLLGGAWLLAVLALAGPAWNKRDQPVAQRSDARVIVLDLSRSMDAVDLKPSRMARARFKVADILARSGEGQIGLVVFAGEAFTVVPLTRDADTIAALLSALEPDIMPAQGGRADLGLNKAGELLSQAGMRRGEILLVGDSVDERAIGAAAKLAAANIRVSVLAVGTGAGAPVPIADGFLKDGAGNIVIPGLDVGRLQRLAAAGGGRYAVIMPDESDLRLLWGDDSAGLGMETERVERKTESWNDEGPWLVLLLLPLAALAFRRGWLVALALLINAPADVYAFGWEDFWARSDQQAAQALEQGDPARAADLAKDPLLRGTANYRAERFAEAAADFAQVAGADGHYNRGNALARWGRYEDAIAAYDAALAEKPDMEDALHNREKVQELLRQQQSQQQEEQQSEQGEDREREQSQNAGGQQGQPQPGGTNQGEQRQADETDAGGRDEQSAGVEQGEQPEPAAQSSPGDEEQQRPPELAEKTSDDTGEQAVAIDADDLFSQEEQQATDQWLRRIQDDPARLLRNKFLYQYQRQGGPSDPGEEAW